MTVFKDLSIALRSSREDDDKMAISTALRGKKSVIASVDSSSAEVISIEESA
jgi:hypothetical protein